MPKFYIECHREGDFTADTFLTVEANTREEAKLVAAEQLRDPDDDYDLAEFFDDTYVLDSCTQLPDSIPHDHSPIAALIYAVEEQLEGRPDPAALKDALQATNDWWVERCDVG